MNKKFMNLLIRVAFIATVVGILAGYAVPHYMENIDHKFTAGEKNEKHKK